MYRNSLVCCIYILFNLLFLLSYTDLISWECSFSRTFSQRCRRKRFRFGEALGVEYLDQVAAASSSLDGVISIEGSCRYPVGPEYERTPDPRAAGIPLREVSLPAGPDPLADATLAIPATLLSLCTFFRRPNLKRLRRRAGVVEVGRAELTAVGLSSAAAGEVADSWSASSPSQSPRAFTWKEGSRRVSVMVRCAPPVTVHKSMESSKISLVFARHW